MEGCRRTEPGSGVRLMATYTIAVIAGDGIGKEVVPAGQAVLEQAARRFGFSLKWRDYDWSCERYAKTGRMMTDAAIYQLRDTAAISLRALRYPGLPVHLSPWGLQNGRASCR